MKKIIISLFIGILSILYAIDKGSIFHEKIYTAIVFAIIVFVTYLIYVTNNKIVLFVIPFVLTVLLVLLNVLLALLYKYQTPMLSLFYLPVITLMVANKLIKEKNRNYFQIIIYLLEILYIGYIIMLFINLFNAGAVKVLIIKPLFFETLFVLIIAVIIKMKYSKIIKKKEKKLNNGIIWNFYFALLILKLILCMESTFYILREPPIELFSLIPDYIFISFMLYSDGKKLPDLNFIKGSMRES